MWRRPPRPRPKPISLAAFSRAPDRPKQRKMADMAAHLYSFRRDDSQHLRYPRLSSGAVTIMSRRTRKPLPKRNAADRPKGERPFRGAEGRPHGHRPGNKPAKRFAVSAPRAPKPAPAAEQPKDEAALLPTKVQTVVVTADENNMRVDR